MQPCTTSCWVHRRVPRRHAHCPAWLSARRTEMCGLAGIVSSHHGYLDERILLAMRDVQRHRGPDEAGIYAGEGVGLGHRRLSIIDLAHGQQPMVDDKAGLALIYNG